MKILEALNALIAIAMGVFLWVNVFAAIYIAAGR